MGYRTAHGHRRPLEESLPYYLAQSHPYVRSRPYQQQTHSASTSQVIPHSPAHISSHIHLNVHAFTHTYRHSSTPIATVGVHHQPHPVRVSTHHPSHSTWPRLTHSLSLSHAQASLALQSATTLSRDAFWEIIDHLPLANTALATQDEARLLPRPSPLHTMPRNRVAWPTPTSCYPAIPATPTTTATSKNDYEHPTMPHIPRNQGRAPKRLKPSLHSRSSIKPQNPKTPETSRNPETQKPKQIRRTPKNRKEQKTTKTASTTRRKRRAAKCKNAKMRKGVG